MAKARKTDPAEQAHLLSEALQARVHEAQTRPFYRATDTEELVLRNAATGEVLKKVNSPHAIRVSRAGLRKLLLDGLDVKVWLLCMFMKGKGD